ncbi:MAG: isoprenyl transferase [Bacteroidetes bacterium]|nr:isoprenyl transferase [Bacteroidota bacterium]
MFTKDQIDISRLPSHVAIIMDGNGRWARQRGLLRTKGHEHAIRAVKDTVEAAAEIGVQYLTLYAFSTENWKRPKYEVTSLMRLLVKSIHRETKTLMDNNIRLKAIGDLKSLPTKSLQELQKAIDQTSGNNRMTLILALSYSARWEILEAAKKMAGMIAKGQMQADKISQDTFQSLLTTTGIPDPELLIRSSGEYRISNFLLWQIAYSELYFTPKLWPDFRKEDLYEALINYQNRERRFGMTSEQIN